MNNTNQIEQPTTIEEEQEAPQAMTQAEGQLSFEKEPPVTRVKQLINWFRFRSRQKMDELEIAQVWKSIAIPFAIVSWLINTLLILIGGVIHFSSMPPTVPLIYDSINNRWEQVDKSVIFIFGIFVGIAELIAIQYIFSVFSNDKRLALTYAWVIAFLNILLLVAIVQIFSLIL